MTDTQETIAKPLREDGRTTLEMRPLRLTTDFTRYAEGSVLIEVGQTRVLCNASVEERVPSFLKGKSVGWITAEYAMLPRATETRTPRESARGGPSGRTHEIQRLIGRSLRSVVDMAALGERTVTVDCDVLQADGGTRTAAVTGGFVAIALALNRHMELGKLQRAPLRDFLAAVSVGIIDGRILLDLNYNEDSRAEVDMNVVRTGDGRLVEVQGTAETEPFDRAQMDEMLAAAELGASILVEAQRAALKAALGEKAFRALAAESAAKINWKESAS